MAETYDFTIDELGKRSIKSPIAMSTTAGDMIANYVTDDRFIRLGTESKLGAQQPLKRAQVLECAGPR